MSFQETFQSLDNILIIGITLPILMINHLIAILKLDLMSTVFVIKPNLAQINTDFFFKSPMPVGI